MIRILSLTKRFDAKEAVLKLLVVRAMINM